MCRIGRECSVGDNEVGSHLSDKPVARHTDRFPQANFPLLNLHAAAWLLKLTAWDKAIFGALSLRWNDSTAGNVLTLDVLSFVVTVLLLLPGDELTGRAHQLYFLEWRMCSAYNLRHSPET